MRLSLTSTMTTPLTCLRALLWTALLPFAANVNANNMLVQNVTTTGNDPTNQTIQVQFDISWDNSWRDSINWDAAWVFMKYKDSGGLWRHVQMAATGHVAGTGTACTILPVSDKVGAFVFRSGIGAGTFASAGMQIQWDYGENGLSDVTGLEVRVFAIEMVYVPQGGFNVAKQFQSFDGFSADIAFTAPGSNFPVIDQRLSPTLTYNDGTQIQLRIKGDAGLDINNNGTVDNTTYPTGFGAFYAYKYELTEQQYADFLNTLTSEQRNTLGVSGSGITLNAGQYFSAQPNLACANMTGSRVLAYADWSGCRPMTLLELNKASYGPEQPIPRQSWGQYPAWGGTPDPQISDSPAQAGYLANATSTRNSAGASYYGLMELTGSTWEPVVRMSQAGFTGQHGNGVLLWAGLANVAGWDTTMLKWVDQTNALFERKRGGRFVRTANGDEVQVGGGEDALVSAGLGVTDVDGNTYPTVLVGYQEWMAANLRVTQYSNGTPVPNVTDGTQWGQLTTPAWAHHGNLSSNDAVYGKLYNAYVMQGGNVCPAGWHVPTDTDWQTLELALGMPPASVGSTGLRGNAENIGGKMKAVSGWTGGNVGATNESLFTALPGGSRLSSGNFSATGSAGSWWSDTANGANTWARSLSTANGGVSRTSVNPKTGYSVRCVRD
jgi:uncharacterized protein (TIGR02145 family)